MNKKNNDELRGETLQPEQEEQELLFDARLTPHRSLSPRGFLLLMSTICCISFIAGFAFFLVGAWPVVGFLGLDVVLIYFAFRINYRSGRIAEDLKLTREELKVVRTNYWGEEISWSFQPYWLQILTEDPKSRECRVLLRSHG
ncbi:MAG: DUF2244 domain-containing protein, partial [Kiloniellales bacterium]|nr:DUF2244 domain-containing protein [Kiloniellales bacterium]